jgi:hypothetical protein
MQANAFLRSDEARSVVCGIHIGGNIVTPSTGYKPNESEEEHNFNGIEVFHKQVECKPYAGMGVGSHCILSYG